MMLTSSTVYEPAAEDSATKIACFPACTTCYRLLTEQSRSNSIGEDEESLVDGNGVAAINEAELDDNAVGLVEINLLRKRSGVAQTTSLMSTRQPAT